MKNIFRTILMISFLAVSTQVVNAQVVMKEYLSTNHQGKIDKSVANSGKPLYYKLEYKNTEGARINYTLHFYKDAAMSTPFLSLPVLMRNLTWTYYVDITMTKDGMSKVFAMIFKKDLRWARVKYSPHEGCSNVSEIVWERINLVDDYEKLINNTLTQMDKNVNLNCYVTK